MKRKILTLALSAVTLFSMTRCSNERATSNYPGDQIMLQKGPLGSAYPGARELMNAPSNDPALNPNLTGDLVRP
jgi:hypothetical protein